VGQVILFPRGEVLRTIVRRQPRRHVPKALGQGELRRRQILPHQRRNAGSENHRRRADDVVEQRRAATEEYQVVGIERAGRSEASRMGRERRRIGKTVACAFDAADTLNGLNRTR
jgi:hypothetical protein